MPNCIHCGIGNRADYPFKCKVCSRINEIPEDKCDDCILEDNEQEVKNIIENVTKLDFMVDLDLDKELEE